MQEKIELRPYQADAVSAVYEHLRTRDDHPCVVIPTAGGKTPVMGAICRDAVTRWGGRVLILAHVKELLEQAVEKLHIMAPDLWDKIGVYSAGLKSRDTEHPIIVAGIQSIYKRAAELDAFDLILIDEAHMLPPDGEGMYRQFLADAKIVNPRIRMIGLTATPYRMSSGMICGPDNLLNHVCFEVGVRELIAQGYLCPLRSKAGASRPDTSGLHIRAGEFMPAEVNDLMDSDALVESACREILDETSDRRSTLIFAAGVDHAKHVQAVLGGYGYDCGFVCGETPATERAETLDRFKNGDIQYLVNVNVLTTGFDAPNIDCVALLRPTNSPGLYYQMVGRGFRLHPGKQNCLILDYGGNIMRHGPVDAMEIGTPGKGDGEAPAKECPGCMALIHAGYSICPECGHEFPPPVREKHDPNASTKGVMSGEVTDTVYEVDDVFFAVHRKRGADDDHPKTMRVDYSSGLNTYNTEWCCPEHEGYARQKFEKWWRDRSWDPPPSTAAEAVAICEAGGIAATESITVRNIAGEKFDRIIDYVLGPKPEQQDRQAESDYSWAEEDDIPF